MTKMDVAIRQATVSDAQGVLDVINSIIDEGGLTSLYPALTLEQEEAFIEGLGPRSAMLLAQVGNEILGVQTIEPFAPYTQAMDHVAIMGTWVYRNFRRQGAGSQLFAAALQFARQQGFEKIIVYVRVGNAVGQAFYRRMGFIPKMMLERQVKIEGSYDDEVWMEYFVTESETAAPAVKPEPVAVPTKPVAPAPTPEPRAAPPLPAPTPAPVAASATRAVDPTVGAVTVRRAKRGDVKTLAAIMRGTMSWSPPSEDEVLEMLFDKGYWLAMSRKGGGLTGWRAENLIMCVDDFYVYPPQFYPQVGGPLLETVETEGRALSCEVAIIFLDKRIAPEAVQFFESQGYKPGELEEFYPAWRESAKEFLTDDNFMMVKMLRERRVMRPL